MFNADAARKVELMKKKQGSSNETEITTTVFTPRIESCDDTHNHREEADQHREQFRNLKLHEYKLIQTEEALRFLIIARALLGSDLSDETLDKINRTASQLLSMIDMEKLYHSGFDSFEDYIKNFFEKPICSDHVLRSALFRTCMEIVSLMERVEVDEKPWSITAPFNELKD
jgi:hypothetical protein